MTITCDVLVVGGGPAGCSAARAASKKGLKTILIEEHEEIGKPVQCAEGIGSYLFDFMPFTIPKDQLKWKINGMYFWADDIAIKKEGGMWSGYSIDRSDWDKWLANLAKKEGVEILNNTKLISLEYGKNYEVQRVEIEKNGKKENIVPNYIIGADGINSTVLDLLNVKKNDTIAQVKSYELENINLKYSRYDQLFFGDFAPRAYAYIFPLSKTKANIGVGSLNKNSNMEKRYENFIHIDVVNHQIKNGNITNEKSGEAPIRNPSDKIVYGNIFLVGDAANQNIKPFIEGNIPGIICGDILGTLIYDIYKGTESPSSYQNMINKKFNLIQESQPFTEIVYGDILTDQKISNLILLGLMTDIIPQTEKDIGSYLQKGYESLKNYILNNGGFIEK